MSYLEFQSSCKFALSLIHGLILVPQFFKERDIIQKHNHGQQFYEII